MITSWRFLAIICFILLYHPIEAGAQEVDPATWGEDRELTLAFLTSPAELKTQPPAILDPAPARSEVNIGSGAPRVALPEGIDGKLFKPSQMISVELSKKELKKLYLEGGQNKTLHCGCFFDKIQQLAPQVCTHDTKGENRLRDQKILTWAHAVPATTFAKPLRCWDEDLCRRGRISGDNGARCCNVLSHKFKKREADMHNLFPAIGQSVGETEESSPVFGGLEEYRFCNAESKSVLSPRPGARGDIARAYFYMARQYKFTIAEDLEDRLRTWHLEDPPDSWEEEKNSLIEIVQVFPVSRKWTIWVKKLRGTFC